MCSFVSKRISKHISMPYLSFSRIWCSIQYSLQWQKIEYEIYGEYRIRDIEIQKYILCILYFRIFRILCGIRYTYIRPINGLTLHPTVHRTPYTCYSVFFAAVLFVIFCYLQCESTFLHMSHFDQILITGKLQH